MMWKTVGGGVGGGAVNLEREGGWFLGKGRVSGSRPDGSGRAGGGDEPVSKDQWGQGG